MSLSTIQRVIYMYEADELTRREAYESIRETVDEALEGIDDDE